MWCCKVRVSIVLIGAAWNVMIKVAYGYEVKVRTFCVPAKVWSRPVFRLTNTPFTESQR